MRASKIVSLGMGTAALALLVACSSSDSSGSSSSGGSSGGSSSSGAASSSGSTSSSGSGSSSGDGGASSSGGSSGASSSSGSSGTGCTVTFGQDASSVKATSCQIFGPFDSSGVTTWTFNGDATGFTEAPLFSYSIKYASPTQVKTYQTADHYYISANMSVASTSKLYFVDFDSQDAGKARHGSVTTTFTSQDHGTIDIVMDSDDQVPAHATVHITF